MDGLGASRRWPLGRCQTREETSSGSRGISGQGALRPAGQEAEKASQIPGGQKAGRNWVPCGVCTSVTGQSRLELGPAGSPGKQLGFRPGFSTYSRQVAPSLAPQGQDCDHDGPDGQHKHPLTPWSRLGDGWQRGQDQDTMPGRNLICPKLSPLTQQLLWVSCKERK